MHADCCLLTSLPLAVCCPHSAAAADSKCWVQVSPLALLPSAACVLCLAGSNIAGPDNTVFARSQGAWVSLLKHHVRCSNIQQQYSVQPLGTVSIAACEMFPSPLVCSASH